MKMATRPDETFISPEYSKMPVSTILKCQKYKYAKTQIQYSSKMLPVVARANVTVNLKAAFRIGAPYSSSTL